ncbi:MAG: hypothetical protein J5I98_12615 [Phaeodactylibacter sp.]|nr:hypothetical protein [Phaeodactylibacter sp.]
MPELETWRGKTARTKKDTRQRFHEPASWFLLPGKEVFEKIDDRFHKFSECGFVAHDEKF